MNTISSAPTYFTEFPGFGPLDVQLPEGFTDQSRHGNTCPSFGLLGPDDCAEWPLLTVFIDFLNTEDREFAGEPRFHVYVGAGLETGDAALRSDDWAEILRFVALRREACNFWGAKA
jgi:hypothetical protein